MKALYLLRVIIISVESLVLALTWLAYTYFSRNIESVATSLSLNGEILKFLMMMPTLLAIWVINEARALLQSDKETICILTDWEDYWKLKYHTWVSLFFSALFVLISIIPWAAKQGISSGTGLLLFIASIIGQLSLAISVYAASIRIKELIAHIKTSKN